MENIKLGDKISRWVENIKVGGNIKVDGEQNAGWRISRWVENIKVGGDIKLGGDNQAGWRNQAG